MMRYDMVEQTWEQSGNTEQITFGPTSHRKMMHRKMSFISDMSCGRGKPMRRRMYDTVGTVGMAGLGKSKGRLRVGAAAVLYALVSCRGGRIRFRRS